MTYSDAEKIRRHDCFMEFLEEFEKQARARSKDHIVHNVISQIHRALNRGNTCLEFQLPSTSLPDRNDDVLSQRALKQLAEQSVGKPLTKEIDGPVIGAIVAPGKVYITDPDMINKMIQEQQKKLNVSFKLNGDLNHKESGQ